MPLFMDLHKGLGIKKAHTAVQEKYNVKFHQYWVNEEAGIEFCLIEGPDKETCAKVHQEAQENNACNIIEVEQSFYELLMGQQQKLKHNLVHLDNGRINIGSQTILMVEITNFKCIDNRAHIKEFNSTFNPQGLIVDYFKRYNGKHVKDISNDLTICFFNEVTDAIECSIEIQLQLLSQIRIYGKIWHFQFKIALVTGQPARNKEDSFEEIFRLAQMLIIINPGNKIYISSTAFKFCEQDFLNDLDKFLFRAFTPEEEDFIVKLIYILEKYINKENFNVGLLSREIGISRPQLYRKLIRLTGRSPNECIRAFRLNKAYHLVKKQNLNISEIAFNVGFNNPSYFAKCFKNEYGISPSKVKEPNF